MLIRVNAFNFLHQMVFEKMILKEFSLYFNKFESTSPKGWFVLCQFWLKLIQWFLRKSKKCQKNYRWTSDLRWISLWLMWAKYYHCTILQNASTIHVCHYIYLLKLFIDILVYNYVWVPRILFVQIPLN